MNRELTEILRDWIPRRDHQYDNYYWRGEQRKKTVYQSPNWKVWVSFGGDIYAFHLNIGKLSISYESDELGR